MTKLAVKYYKEGFNCSQCILKAFEEKYNYYIGEQFIQSSGALSGGLGTGTVCGALLSGVMIFGILFDDVTVKRLRMALYSDMVSEFGSINCSKIKHEGGCEAIIVTVAAKVEELIVNELMGR